MKRVLVVYYTQSGQLKEIIDSVLSPLTEVTIDFLPIDTATPFPFPWTDDTFFDAFPESYLQIPQPLQPFNLPHTDYDLVIFGLPSVVSLALYSIEFFFATPRS